MSKHSPKPRFLVPFQRVNWFAATLVLAAAIANGSALINAATRTGLPVPAPPTHSVARSDFGMVATGSPEASSAAVKILEMGGNAIDAAVAAALTLGVADPDASGLGGMTYMVIHLTSGQTLVIDGTSPTPMAVDPVRLQELKTEGRLLGHELAAVPTTLAVLERARSRFGTLDLATLIEPAIATAEKGYRLGPTQIIWTDYYREELLSSGYLRGITYPDGDNVGQVGKLVCRPDLAQTLRRIARDGVRTFYRGRMADQIEDDMIRNGGFLRKTDLARLRVKEVLPVHTTYRDVDVLTFPPPGGGTALVEVLNILESFPTNFLAEDTAARHHVLLETFRIALADRGLAPANSDPLQRGFSPASSKMHARRRATMIEPGKLIPDTDLYGEVGPECAPPGESTTHVSVVDRWGNVVSLTQTLGRSWGAKVATPGLGFPYNSFLETFNYERPQCPGYLQPHLPCPTDMAPTIVLAEDGTLLAALGSPGSDLIASIVANVISNLVDRHMGLEEAIAVPRVLFGGLEEALGPYIEVTPPITGADVDALETMGHTIAERFSYPAVSRTIVLYGGVNAVGWDADEMTFVGVGDGRRWGSAQGARAVTTAVPNR
jgi:gamma-glutamyltranspeptidase/glutathione hydrolase